MKAVEVSAENLIVEVGNQQKIKPSTMSKDTEKAVVGLSGVGLGLDELVRHGARQVIQQAIEAELAELAELMERFANVKTLHGQRAVVRNGYLPEREVLTGAGPIAVKVPKVRDRSGSGVKFQFDDRAAVREEVASRERSAALAVSEGYLDGRHGRSVERAAGR